MTNNDWAALATALGVAALLASFVVLVRRPSGRALGALVASGAALYLTA